MSRPSLRDFFNSIFLFFLKSLHSIFGNLQWQAPAWIPWIGLQMSKARRYLTANRKRPAIAALVLLAAVVGITWNHFRPRPHYILYNVTAPQLTEFNENGIPTLHPLTVDFETAAAPLANLDKRLSSGIEISPALAGTWTWVNDKRLRFAPSSDWPVDASFTVKIRRHGFLA